MARILRGDVVWAELDPTKGNEQADYLYKYRSLEGPGRLYTERLLVHNEVYFASPAKFNDPFDSKARISGCGTDRQFRKHHLKLLTDKEPGLSEEARLAKVEKIIRSGKHRDPSAYESITKNTKADVDELGVFCLTEHPDSILMWSHYASSHSGFCIQLRRKDILSRCEKVRYSRNYPIIVYPGSDDNNLDKWLLTKAACWKYEAEWRKIERAGPGTYNLPPQLLTGVILGSRITKSDHAQVCEWSLQRKPQPRLYEARPRRSQFALDIVPIE
jgi:Protein of unknown function (DUF2971)